MTEENKTWLCDDCGLISDNRKDNVLHIIDCDIRSERLEQESDHYQLIFLKKLYKNFNEDQVEVLLELVRREIQTEGESS